jgi:hypothetical protein
MRNIIKLVICFFIILETNFLNGQVVLTQTHTNATIGLDRKAFLGLGNTSAHSDGYAHDFTLPAGANPCQKISSINVVIALTNYTNNNSCPHPTLYYNLYYGCGPYSGGATCLPATSMIAQPNFAPNTSPPPFNYGCPLGSSSLLPSIQSRLQSCNQWIYKLSIHHNRHNQFYRYHMLWNWVFCPRPTSYACMQ